MQCMREHKHVFKKAKLGGAPADGGKGGSGGGQQQRRAAGGGGGGGGGGRQEQQQQGQQAKGKAILSFAEDDEGE
jgi:hypothetical protein